MTRSFHNFGSLEYYAKKDFFNKSNHTFFVNVKNFASDGSNLVNILDYLYMYKYISSIIFILDHLAIYIVYKMIIYSNSFLES